MNYAIIAAGEGSRLQQEGVPTPKPLVELNGTPMIKRLIDIFCRCGAEKISVIVNQQMTQVQDFLHALKPDVEARGIKFDLVIKSTPSSMHSFYEVSRNFDGRRFILTTVDTIFRESDFKAYAETFESAGPDIDGCMAVTSYIDDEKPLYVETDADMNITGFADNRPADARYISGGIYGLDGKALDVLVDCMDKGVSRMRNFQRALVAAGLRLKAFDMGKIIDVDHQEDILKAEKFINE